jgi:hypothetical protein
MNHRDDHDPLHSAPPIRRDPIVLRRFLPLALLALAVRAVVALWTTTIAADAAYYLWIARDFAAGRIESALGSHLGIHPMYSLLTALLGTPIRNLEAAAYAVSVACGGLAVIPFYLLVRTWWNDRIALWAGLTYALHPMLIHEGSEVMSTGLFLSLFITSVSLFVWARRTGRLACYTLAGFAAAACYLTRPEGVYLVALFVAAVLWMVARRFWSRTAAPRSEAPAPPAEATPSVAALGFAVCALAFLVAAGPYLLWIHARTGTWSFSTRPSAAFLTRLLGADAFEMAPPWALPGQSRGAPPSAPASPSGDPVQPVRVAAPAPSPSAPAAPAGATSPPVPAPPHYPTAGSRGASFIHVIKRCASAFCVVLLPFGLIGFLLCRRLGGEWQRLFPALGIAAAAAIPPVALYVATRGSYGFSCRYLLPSVVFLLPWCAAGIVQGYDWLTRFRPQVRIGRFMATPASLLPLLLTALVAAKGLGPRRADEKPMIAAGAWVKSELAGAPARALATREKLAYYAGCEHVPWPRAGGPHDDPTATDAYVRQIRQTCQTQGIGWLLVDDFSLRKFPAGLHEGLAAQGFREASRFPANGSAGRWTNAVRVYRAP